MPTPLRRVRALLALAVVTAVVAGVPGATLGAARDARDGARRPAPAVARPAAPSGVAGSADPATARDSRLLHRAAVRGEAPQRVAWIRRATPDLPRPRAKSVPTASAAAAAPAPSLRGRDHVWIPALGIDRSVTGYACSSSAYPGDRVYRWGCAGANNVYLFGHAHSVFKPLHDAYVRGRLSKGMRVHYADGRGRVATYAVSWWKVTTPDRGAWAYAAQSAPSLTLQTCVGAKSQYRLIVRLRKVG
jgi:sortase (surface protein transpeptidase)